MKYKVILSLRIARHLLASGFTIVDVEPSRKVRGEVAFIFEYTPELKAELSKLLNGGK